MKRLNYLAGAALALTGVASTAALAAPAWGPSGEASYEEHQARAVSQYTRAQVQSAYLRAAAAGALPRTAEVVAESPAQLVLAAAPLDMAVAAATPAQEPVTPAEAAPAQEQTPVQPRPGHAGQPGIIDRLHHCPLAQAATPQHVLCVANQTIGPQALADMQGVYWRTRYCCFDRSG